MKARLLCTFSLAFLLAACTTTTTTTPTRSWKVLAANVTGGALMSGTVLPDGTPLLVGGQSTLGAAWLWKGGTLQPLTVPAGKLLSWVSSLPDGTSLAVGNGRRALWRTVDGTFKEESLPDGDELWGCVVLSKDEAWAVGGNPLPDATATPVLLHRTAAGWASVALPLLAQPKVRLFKVDAHSASDVLVVGDEGEALHFDGTAWKEEATGTGVNLTTVRKWTGGRYVAVGGQNTGVTRYRDSAGAWHILRDVESGLSGVDVWDDRLWACGAAGWIESIAVDGASAEPADPLTNDDLHLMLRLPNGDGLAGGGNFGAFKGTMHGTLLGWTE